MTKTLHDWCYQADRKKTQDYKSNVRGFLRRYVIGDEVDNLKYMKSWTDHIFELRIQLSPRAESTRIFGAFIEADCFVATHWRMRKELGEKASPAWEQATNRSLSVIADLFPGHHPRYSRPFDRCVTFNAIDNFNPR